MKILLNTIAGSLFDGWWSVCNCASPYPVGLFLKGCKACSTLVNSILIIYSNYIANSYQIFIK